jgi:hypothetical protein
VPKRWFRKADPDALVVRAGSPVKRDVYKAATAGVTGITAFGALAVTGAVAGTAAHDKALQDAAKAAATPPPAAPTTAAQAAPKRRPHRTIVHTKVVHAASTPTVTRPATGGTVTSHATSSTTTHTSTVTHAAPKPAPAPAPAPKPAPKPAPAPAPSSGS